MSIADFPKITGKQIKKEKADASFFEAPKSNAQQIVAPDLEIPGRIAIDCAIPTNKAVNKVIFLFLCLFFCNKKE